MATKKDVALKISVRDPQGNFLGGTVDIRLEHRRLKSALRILSKVDASREIAIGELRRKPDGLYEVLVEPTEPAKKSMKQQVVDIPSSGFVTLDFVFEREIVRDEPEPPQGEREVRGVLRYATGMAAPGLQILAFDLDLRSEELLGEALTDGGGVYRIEYSEKQFRKHERGGADLVVRVLDAGGEVMVASQVMYNAPPQAEIDLTIPLGQGPALFDRIATALGPLLGRVKIEELEENQDHQDLSFLSGETGFGKRDLARFVLAHHLVQLGIQAELWFALLGGSLLEYSESRSLDEHQASVTAALVTVDALAARKALDRAFAVQDIAATLAGESDEWIDAFLAITAGLALGDSDDPTFLKGALDDAGIVDPGRQAKFARLFNRYRALTPQLLAELEQDPAFEEVEIADLRTSYRLSDLSRGDFSVVRALKKDFGVRRPEQIRTLAKLGESHWVDWARNKHQAGEIELPLRFDTDRVGPVPVPEAEIYGTTLERQFREAFPTAAFAGGLERALDGPGPGGLRRGRELGAFLDVHPGFELQSTRIDTFLDNGVDTEFRELAQDQDFRLELKGVQRVFKLAPTFEATDTLFADGVHSAQGVYRMGESAFVQRYAERPGFTPGSARLTWQRAADTHAAVLTVVGDLQALQAEALPAVLTNGGDQALARFPNWENLFRAGDLCDCDHCRSVLGPAAYFADLLLFLRDRKTVKLPAKNVRDVLFGRRPDLGYLELGCENALTTLPHVDVVCEVLERAVDDLGDNDLELTGFTVIPSDPAVAKADVAQAFETAFGDSANDGKEKIPLGSDFSLSQVNPTDPNRWVAHGDNVTYLLKKQGAGHFFAEVLPNIKAKSAELRAYPAYVNPKAYDKLRQARFPFSLPFDLFAKEVRAGFQKSGIQRWDLMRTLRGSAAPNNPTDGEIAAEYFGISADPTAAFDEKRLILKPNTTPNGQRVLWGEAGTAQWLKKLSNVKTFLGKTGLEYQELLALIDLPFIDNPAGTLFIEHLDSSCDTDQKRLRGLNVNRLDRIHRFLRLWRKLDGWRMWELDLVILHPAIGKGSLNEAFLIALYHFSRLRSRLGSKVTVEQVCALMGDLNTATHFVEAHEKRGDGLYQSLFLNKRLLQPLDPAFEVAAVDVGEPAAEKISGHKPVILAALRTREADLDQLASSTRTDGTDYVTDDLTLANLSFLWRHTWLAKLLKLNTGEWQTLLKLYPDDVKTFAGPEEALDFVEVVDHLKASGFKSDELDWILAANRSAKAALEESDAARFLTGLRAKLAAIRAEYDPTHFDFLQPPADEERLTGLLTSLLQQLHRDEAGARFFVDVLRDEVASSQEIEGWPNGFEIPEAIKAAIRIHYDASAKTLRFTGLMTDTERIALETAASLSQVTGIASYQQAIEAFFEEPRLALKFLDPAFTAPLSVLPAAVDFTALPDPALRSKITYDAEQRVLRVVGILSHAEREALDALSADPGYMAAVASLFTQPRTGVFSPEKLWLEDADLLIPLRDLNDPSKDNLKANLATAIQKVLPHLSTTLSQDLVILRASTQLGLTEGLTRRLLTHYALLPETLLEHLTGPFAASTGVVDYATAKPTFDGWNWAHRTAMAWTHWKLTLTDRERLDAVIAGAQILDFAALALDDTVAPPSASLEEFLRTDRLLRFRDRQPETGSTFLEVLQNLDGGAYATVAAFAEDVERMNEMWRKDDTEALVSMPGVDLLDLTDPAHYLLAESWERLHRAFVFLESLNAGAKTASSFAATAMTDDHAKTLKELLRSRFGADSWLALSTEIQDVLRERKRDALAAYLLSQPQPADAPSGKWDNSNDLYAHYLLDVEMSACQLTSRLVQASGSVQLFVQRCFMGLEPDVEVKADGDDGDSAWRWWKWMRKYRVWEANRKVFLWPENWIEPELKRDRSAFFKDLENELLQNEIGPDTVEAAFANYLEKLDGVAQLGIAGFYQEDDGDDTILHVFGRTSGAEPHLYYYRRYDYRQWTPWEKVDLDIQGDYLVPAVIGGRLYLFWPVFTEVPDEAENSGKVPIPVGDVTEAKVKSTSKKLQMQMAVSDYRQGRWTPRRLSKSFDQSIPYSVEIIRNHYTFLPIDRTAIDGRFLIRYEGYSSGARLERSDEGRKSHARMWGAFEVSGCDGVPERTALFGSFWHAVRPEPDSAGDETVFLRWEELESRIDQPENDLTFETALTLRRGLGLTPVLQQTPWRYLISPPLHLSYLDRLMDDGLLAGLTSDRSGTPVGSWLPFFYRDKKRTFFALPSLWAGMRDGELEVGGSARSYYPEIKQVFRQWDSAFESQLREGIGALDLTDLNAADRAPLEERVRGLVSSETAPPFEDEQLRDLMVRLVMRYVHWYLGQISLVLFQLRQFHFKNFYHPFVCDFAKLIHNPLQGIPGLMKRETQLQDSGFSFYRSYQPTLWVVDSSWLLEPNPDPAKATRYPKEIVDFSPDGAYSPYNWELFFHAPLLIANCLSKNQRFEEARDWYHYIFNPIGVESVAPGGSATSKYWITKPFFETTDPEYKKQRIENLLTMLADGGDSGELQKQVIDWRKHPFEPHLLANYRTVAYQKTVVMKYLDNLIAWGDFLFRQDSMESINEATQLYVLAAEILGPRPKKIPPQVKPPLESFNELEASIDAFGNALVEVENLVPVQSGSGTTGGNSAPLPFLYFCIPHNEKLLGYWDTVADRLYKIRHCMNIEGVVRQLALFEPPIDPGALVKAVAGGLDIGAALADLGAPLPLYRFNVLLQKANEVCNDVKALGGALLSALEKKDAEALALLRQGQEIRVLDAVKAVREKQIEEAKEQFEGVRRSKFMVEVRRDYYRDIEKVSGGEKTSMTIHGLGIVSEVVATILNATAGTAHLVPEVIVGASGFGGSPHVTVKYGGSNAGQSAGKWAAFFSGLAGNLHSGANLLATQASNERRWEEWKLQERIAERELLQIDKSIAAAELRVAIAEKELENHLMQIDNAKAIDEFMRSKYTNQELYQWQVGQISGVYFQSYRLAFDLAKRAERCFRFELGLQDSSFIQFGYWDSLKKGLLSGERLQYDLRRLDSAYLEQNRREFELTKQVSLRLLDPLALIKLRETGRCFFNLPEEIFDLDYPGHYFRRIKSVRLTLPCVTGPYTTISCTLRLLKNSIRINTANGTDGYPRNTDDDGLPLGDERFVENNIPVKAIATSNGQNDGGVFELNFRDERYLPFEGAGAVSKWALELFNDSTSVDFGRSLRQFDYGSITDAVVHVSYTAREDAGVFKSDAIKHLRSHLSPATVDPSAPSLLILDLRRDFASQWSRFLHPAAGNVFELEVSHRLFPYRDTGQTLEVRTIHLLARSKVDNLDSKVTLLFPDPQPAKTTALTLSEENEYGGLRHSSWNLSNENIKIVPASPPVTWRIELPLDALTMEDLILVLEYRWEK